MAKGRRLTTSLSERYLGSYAGHSHSHAAPVDGPDFLENDVVWSTGDGACEFDATGGGQYDYYGNTHAPGSEWDSRASRAPPSPTAGGLSLAFEGSGGTTSSRIVHQLRAQDGGVGLGARPSSRQRHMATSAPMNVPDWSKILRVDSAESCNDSEDGCFEDELDSAVDPPHEYLARSRKTGATTSVFEGVGRTLKGRDMSRLRDAVWSQTGFDG